MASQVDQLLNDAQQLLEQGFQECLNQTDNLHRRFNDLVRERIGSRSLSNQEILDELSEFSVGLYKSMAETLFRLIGVLQPEDCRDNQPINLYFWPGYHSYHADKRIFVRQLPWNLGVGICGSPRDQTLNYYYSCSQARWYRYLIKHCKKSGVAPIDIHRRLLQYDRDLTPSLIVTTDGLASKLVNQQVLHLASNSRTEYWGELLAEFIRENTSQADSFDTGDTICIGKNAPFIKQAQAKMQSLWLHAAFCNSEPDWLRAFIRELEAESQTEPVSISLREALSDEIATDWGDKSTHRPHFRNWINLSLRAWLDPSIDDDDQRNAASDQLKNNTVGSAAFLSSITLRSGYLALVRSWVSEVYNAVRNAEIAILLHNRELGAREAMAAGPYFAHELQKMVDQGLATAQLEFDDEREEAVRTRRFVLYSIRTLCNLAYSITNAVMSRNKQSLDIARKQLIIPLQQLRKSGALVTDLPIIAEEIYKSVKHEESGDINFHGKSEAQVFASDAQYGACFLLVVEMLRNYCQAPQSGPPADFRVWLDLDTLVIELKGPTVAQRNPVSMTFARLNVFLHTLNIGKATAEWERQLGVFTFTVEVNLGSKIPASTS